MNDDFSIQKEKSKYFLILKVILLSIITTLVTLYLVLNYFSDYLVRVERLGQKSIGYNQEVVTKISEGIPDIVEKTSPAVVSVVVTADVPVIEQYFEEYNPFDSFFGRGFGFSIPQQRQIGTEKKEIGGGTGFFVSADGYIVTNRHVVDNERAEYSIITNEGDSHDVEVVAKDPTLDIAILKVKSDTEFPYLSFGNSDEVRLGSTVIAIGNALAEFPNSISVGVVSGLFRNIVAGNGLGQTESLEGVIQTDAAINRGNSGGPLLNILGEVIGVNVAVAGNGENIGFALPAASVESVFESVKENGEIIRPFLGVRYLQIDKEIAKENGLDVDYGVLIVRGKKRTELAVLPGSAADKAGIEENDIILEIEGKKLDGKRSLMSILRGYEVGDNITLKVLHDGEEKELKVILEKAPEI